MGFLSKTAQVLGFGTPQTDTSATTSMTKGTSIAEAFGYSSNVTPSFGTYNSMRAQMESYYDWVYAAASRVAEEASCIDFELYRNASPKKSAGVARKIAGNYKATQHYKAKRLVKNQVFLRNGLVQVAKAGHPALEEIDDSPLLDLLDRPNKFMSGTEFFELTFLHLELTGNAFWAVIRGKGKQPVELWPLYPNYMRIVEDSTNFISGYVYTVNGEQIPFTPEDIIHHKYSNPNDLRWGQSTVQAAASIIDTDHMASTYNRKFFYNSAQPDAILYTDKVLDAKVFDRIKEQFNNAYGGAANAHRTAVLDNNLQYKPMNLSQKDMDFLKSREFNRDMILAMFGVPKSVLGMDASMSRANAETAEYVFNKGTIKPKMMRMATGIQEKLAPEFDENIVVSFADPVPADKEYELKKNETLTNLVLTVNEVREDMGYEPVDDGDLLYVSSSVRPLGQQMDTTTTATPETPEETPAEEDIHGDNGDDNGGAATDEGDTGAADANADASNNTSGGSKGYTINIANIGDKDTAEKLLKALQALDLKKKDSISPETYLTQRNKIADKYEPQMIKAVISHTDKQEQEVLANVSAQYKSLQKAAGKKVTKAAINDLFDAVASGEGWQAVLSVIFENIISATGIVSIKQLIEATGEELDDYDPKAPSVKEFYTDRIRRISVYFDQQTQKQLATTLLEGIENGESVDELRARVHTVYDATQAGTLMRYRAERIGRTEPIFASSWATIDSWKNSGVVIGKRWHTAPEAVPHNNNPCGFCRNMDNKVVELESNYFDLGDTMSVTDENGTEQTMKLNYVDTIGPPLHPGCRCVLLPVLEGEDLE